MAFLGTNYMGMQINLQDPTIEKELFEALQRTSYVPGKAHYSRSARTDRGVSALGQVVSFIVLRPWYVKQKQAHAVAVEQERDEDGDADVEVNDKTPVVDANVNIVLSNTKKRPVEDDDGEQEDDEVGGDEDKVVVDESKVNAMEIDAARDDGDDAYTDDWDDLKNKLNEQLPKDIVILKALPVGRQFEAQFFCHYRRYCYVLPVSCFAPYYVKPKDFVFNEKEQARVNGYLAGYVGTRSFHNFTSDHPKGTPDAQRTIKSFKIAELVSSPSGEQYALLEVVGQSFMIHMIRKMIGLCILLCRCYAPPLAMAEAFQLDKMPIPMAPGLGLFLDECMFPTYNEKSTQERGDKAVLITFDNEPNSVRMQFREKIINNVFTTEKERKWKTMDTGHHNYYRWLIDHNMMSLKTDITPSDVKTAVAMLKKKYGKI